MSPPEVLARCRETDDSQGTLGESYHRSRRELWHLSKSSILAFACCTERNWNLYWKYKGLYISGYSNQMQRLNPDLGYQLSITTQNYRLNKRTEKKRENSLQQSLPSAPNTEVSNSRWGHDSRPLTNAFITVFVHQLERTNIRLTVYLSITRPELLYRYSNNGFVLIGVSVQVPPGWLFTPSATSPAFLLDVPSCK